MDYRSKTLKEKNTRKRKNIGDIEYKSASAGIEDWTVVAGLEGEAQ